MSWLDVALIVSILSYILGGMRTGLIQSIGGVVGLFIGGIVASRAYEPFGNALTPVFNGNALVAKVFAFILLFLLVTRLIGAAFYLVNKMFNFIAIVPGLKLANHLGGAIFGFIEGALFVGITLQFMSRLPISTPFAQTIADSQIASIFLGVAGWLMPLFPAALKEAENVVDKVVPK